MKYGIPRPDLPAAKLLEKWERDSALDPNLTQFDHAGQLGIPTEIYEGRLYVAEQERTKKTKPGLFNYQLPGRPWELEGDWMIVGDVHVPFTDIDFAALVSLVAKKHLKKPRRLLVAGDFFNMDVFSTWAELVHTPDWAEEREAAKNMLHLWLETFQEVRLIMGNHDRRLQKFVAGAFDESDILSLVISNPERVQMSGYGYCTIKSGGQSWRITHPKNYGINQLTVAEGLAQKYGTNVISFHEHHLSVGWDRYKRYVLVNGGCLVEPSKLAYVSLDDSKSAGMAKGFIMLRDGTPYVFGEAPITDWRRWL